MSVFSTHTADTAPSGSQPMVAATQARFGFVPGPVGRMATSPHALGGFLKLNAIFAKSSLDELARECLIFAVATRHECHHCVAMHSKMLVSSTNDRHLVGDLRAERPLEDPRLEAVRCFVHDVIDSAGAVPDAAMQRFLAAGFTPENALDVVLGVATYTLSTFANRMTDAPLDETFSPWEWHKETATRRAPDREPVESTP